MQSRGRAPSGAPAATVGAVVVTFNSATTIGATLDALCELPLAEFVVVDNGSTDATTELVRRGLPAHGRLVEQANVGFGAGNNRGIRELTTDPDLLLLLNPDAQIGPDDLDRLVRYLDARPEVALVGPRFWKGDEPLHSASREATALTETRTLLPPAVARLLPDKRFAPAYAGSGEVRSVLGACMLVRREALAEVGGFDERFFLFFEELDVGNRLRRAGWQVHLVGDATAQHAVSASRKTVAGFAQEHYWASTWLYLRLWRGRASAAVWRAAAVGTWRLRRALRRIDQPTYRRWVGALDVVAERVA